MSFLSAKILSEISKRKIELKIAWTPYYYQIYYVMLHLDSAFSHSFWFKGFPHPRHVMFGCGLKGMNIGGYEKVYIGFSDFVWHCQT